MLFKIYTTNNQEEKMNIEQRKERILFSIFLITYFVILYALSISWWKNGYYEANDIFFASDPRANLRSFAHGWNWGRAAFSHPLIEFFAVPIRLMDIISFKIGLIENREKFREVIALLISPLFSTLTLVFFYKIISFLTLDKNKQIIFTLIFSLSFSNIFFGIIPETFSISCFFISVLMYLYLKFEKEGYEKKFLWLILSIFLPGITITNAVIFFIVFWFKSVYINQYSILKSTFQSGIVTLFGVITATLIFYITSLFLKFEIGQEGNVNWIVHYLNYDQVANNLINLISASLNSFFIYSPTIIPHHLFYHVNAISFVRPNSQFVLWLTLTVIFIFYIYKSIKINDEYKNISILSISIIIFNFSLHSIFGQEMLLYTQHWFVVLFILFFVAYNRYFNMILLFLIISFTFNLYFFLNVSSILSPQGL